MGIPPPTLLLDAGVEGCSSGAGHNLQELFRGQGTAGALAEVVQEAHAPPLQRRRRAAAGHDRHPAPRGRAPVVKPSGTRGRPDRTHIGIDKDVTRRGKGGRITHLCHHHDHPKIARPQKQASDWSHSHAGRVCCLLSQADLSLACCNRVESELINMPLKRKACRVDHTLQRCHGCPLCCRPAEAAAAGEMPPAACRGHPSPLARPGRAAPLPPWWCARWLLRSCRPPAASCGGDSEGRVTHVGPGRCSGRFRSCHLPLFAALDPSPYFN